MVLGYLPSLVLGRVAQSDMPSTALAALALWLFWARGSDRRMRWAASGLVAGLALSVRETNALLFAPLYLGALIRREGGTWALIAGGLASYGRWAHGSSSATLSTSTAAAR
jgi:4-amino-4-deoxy-L-arabinose transferase-like glycosyltransferase